RRSVRRAVGWIRSWSWRAKRSTVRSIDVERPAIADRFGDVARVDPLGVGEIGDRARELLLAMQRARRPVLAARDLAQQRCGGRVERAVPVDLGRRQERVGDALAGALPVAR